MKSINEAVFFQKENPRLLQELVENIPPYVTGMLELHAPRNWEGVHLATINLWQKKLTAYKALLEIENDPLGGYLALQKLPEFVQEDVDLQNIMIREYDKLIL